MLALETQVLQKALVAMLHEKRPDQSQQLQQLHKSHGQTALAPPTSRLGGRCSVVASSGLSLDRRYEMIVSAIEASQTEMARVRAEILGTKRLLKVRDCPKSSQCHWEPVGGKPGGFLPSYNQPEKASP